MNIADEIVGRAPPVRRASKRALARERQLSLPLGESGAFVRYADSRTDLAYLRERAIFNLGVELGVAVGRTERGETRRTTRRLRATLLRAAARLRTRAPDEIANELCTILRISLCLGRGPARAAEVARIAEAKRRRRAR